MTGETKVCSKCGIEKPLDDFYKDKNKKDGHYPKCNACRSEYYKEHYVSKKKIVIYDSDITSKICHTCGEEKDLSAFGKDKSKKDGYIGECKICHKKYYDNNKEHIKEKRKQWDESHKNYNKEYRNGEKFKGYQKEYKNSEKYKKFRNSEKLKEYKKEYLNSIKYKEYLNSEGYKKNKKEYRENNRDIINKKNLERKKRDSLFKLKCNIRCLVSIAIKRIGYSKISKTEIILGCSFEYFKEYIESKFEPWMNWDNYGKYNGTPNFGFDIDHIIPLNSAKTEEDVIRLNHYTNLQPLCSYVNRYVKRDKILT